MTLRSTLLLAGALLAGATGTAGAQAPGGTQTLYGSGSSLIAPYIRQAGDCWGDRLSLASRGLAATSLLNLYNFTRNPPFNCATDKVAPGYAISYISTGSGRGVLSYFSHSPAAQPADVIGSPAPTGGVQPPGGYAANMQFALSETAIARTAVVSGNAGSVNGSPVSGVTTPGVDTYNLGGEIGVVVSGSAPNQTLTRFAVRDPANTNGGQFPNPRNSYGAMIQIPILVAPITVAFDPVYKKVADANGTVTTYSFNYTGRTPTGGLPMSRATMCGIFQGQITNWNQVPGVTADPNDPDQTLNVPLQIVGRSDSSGTTSGFTRHLSAVCGTTFYANSTATLPAALRTNAAVYNANNDNTPVPGEALGLFTLAPGNEGVAKYIAFTRNPAPNSSLIQGRVAYLGSDYVLPYVANTGQNNFGLVTAAVQNAAGNFARPTPQAVNTAFVGVLPPNSTSSGTYNPSAAGDRSDPAASTSNGVWVQASDRLSIIADPQPAAALYYPIVATTNALIYTCYANPTETSAVRGFFNWFFTSPVVNDQVGGILAGAGFSPVSQAFRRAILDTFINDTEASATLNTRILQAGTTPTSSTGTILLQCSNVSPGA
ncbi:MAG: substrate-binding domain-containing protein [Sphingomonadaceae bacterium]|nr:substrate-binding domain-containing protein [Sphingomonadaceae bacterium]